MVNSPRPQERENPYLQSSPSPKPNGNFNTSSTSSSTSSNSNGVQPQSPLTPKPISRSETNTPYPTTFIQADSSSFKQVVQMLTGSSETTKQATKPINNIPPIKNGPKKQGFKLYERRNSLKNLKISPLMPGFVQRNPEILSPSILDFPSLVLSPVTPLIPDPFNRSPPTAEQRAIAEKGFYLHPSPVSTPRDSEPPRLLPLFPVTSPRVSGSS
ncbi:hypothetical protein GIB67_014509 [Kingdonia uniflora]|uniref:VQ domain-containing protein n=1 Tax=Kingdonia uniflora TaxID=39325 RepID=A0A7J7NMR1_9MAGN|nr:hypothetical protein GIB67_014509 [Kingdonia uniflora]